ncbi:MAG: transporter [Verrucomicrobiales bacterium]|nr:transporter [Verrucomicrobiales bacterium]
MFKNKTQSILLITTAVVATLLSTSLQADDSKDTSASVSTEAKPATDMTDADAIAKKLANPIASMTSLPLQSNFDFGGGPDGDGFQYKANFQPVIPFSLSEDWNLITRTIIPFVYQENVIGDTSQNGFSDTVFSAWLSPAEPTASGWTWGVGPAFLIPTGTNNFLTADQWAAGPTAIALRQTKYFTYGALVNQLWAFSGENNRESVNQMFVQPFLVYLPGGGWTISLNTENTYNFTTNQFTIPINLAVNKMFKIGKVPAQWQLGARYYAEAPENGPKWGLRASLTLIIPKS